MSEGPKMLSMSERLRRFNVHPLLLVSIAWLFVVYAVAAYQPAMVLGDRGLEVNMLLRPLRLLAYLGWAQFGLGIILTAQRIIDRVSGDDLPPEY